MMIIIMKNTSEEVSRGQVTRERLLSAAAKRFRVDGVSGTSIGSVMREIGLTHGGFYAHFANKEELFAASVEHAAAESGDWLEDQVAHLSGTDWVEKWVDIYLSDGHCSSPDSGCPIPSLLPEIAREGSSACAAFGTAIRRRLERVREHLPCEPDEAERRFLSAYSHMAGAVMLSRVLGVAETAQLRSDVGQSVKAMLLHDRSTPQ